MEGKTVLSIGKSKSEGTGTGSFRTMGQVRDTKEFQDQVT